MSAEATVRLLTPRGVGGIAVVELAGDGAEVLLGESFRARGTRDVTFEPERIYYGHIVQGAEVLDEVLVSRLAASEGVTVFEINCHGGLVPAERVMEHLVSRGASVGREGGVVLGRRVRKLERELVGQLIRARTQRAAEVLLVQLSGRLRAELERLAAGGDPDDLKRRLQRLRASWTYGHRLVDPATVVITGAPNVGKSTLANALAGRERSIVHHLPGTTRDAVSSVASLDGLPVVVVDTAGLRQASDEIERIGVAHAVEKATSAHVVVWVFDHSRPLADDETRYLKALEHLALVPVINKIDLEGPLDASEVQQVVGVPVLRTCGLTGRGIDDLERRLFGLLAGTDVPPRDAAVVTTASVASALEEAARRIDRGADGPLLDEALLS